MKSGLQRENYVTFDFYYNTELLLKRIYIKIAVFWDVAPCSLVYKYWQI
jgi:hypothetical protein